MGHIMSCTDKMPADKMLVDKRTVKIVRGNKILAIFGDRKNKMPILSKLIIYHTEGQIS